MAGSTKGVDSGVTAGGRSHREHGRRPSTTDIPDAGPEPPGCGVDVRTVRPVSRSGSENLTGVARTSTWCAVIRVRCGAPAVAARKLGGGHPHPGAGADVTVLLARSAGGCDSPHSMRIHGSCP